MLNKGLAKNEIFEKLSVYKNMDLTYESGRILSSMCTKPDSLALEAYKMFIESNLGDYGLFKGTTLMEREVISSLGKLLHLDDASGHIVTGGTEANIMAMCVAKYLFQSRSNNVPEVILPISAHFSFKKIISMLSIKAVYVPLNEEYKMDVSRIEELINENTMAIVAVAGTTELGMVDDIEKISKIALSNDIYLHVDAAFGGFIIPFLDNENNTKLNFDFSCEGVSSITIDPHKMGLAPVPAGGIIFRHKKHLEMLSIETPYLTKDKQTTIVGTRSGASAAATWAVLNYYGKEGYKKVVIQAMDLTNHIYERLSSMTNVDVICKPELNVIAFTSSAMDVDTLKKELLNRGWYVSIGEYPHAIRLVLMPHVKKEHIDSFLDDLDDILKRG